MSKFSIHFNISERKVLLKVLDILSVLLVLYGVSHIFEFNYFVINRANWKGIVILVIYLALFGAIFELYDLQKASKIDKTFANIVLTVSTTVLFYLLTPFYSPFLPDNRLQILYFYGSILLGLFIWRWMYISFIASPRFYKKALVVGEFSNIKAVVAEFKTSDPNYHIVGFVNTEIDRDNGIKFDGLKEFNPKDICQVVEEEKISEIVIASYHPEAITVEIYRDLITLLESGFPIKEYTQIYEEMTQSVPVQFIGKDFYKYFPFSRNNQNKLYLFFRRLFDIIISVIGIIGGGILLPLILIGNIIGNRGKLFYKQERVGKNGRLFQMIKFRSMIKNAEKDRAVWAEKNDVRITPFGRFLRYSRLDEIPQFINILKGEMSLIGPRPERPPFVKELSALIPFYETRHMVKPGLTGWAQVKMKYGNSTDDSLLKLQYDLFYIKYRSFFLDFNIVVKTISTIIFFRGQ
ncbi:exopolysaccharide biosynthesis polyprenyl glycosylphosphotransferase [Algibacter pacificus]|uniref:exopolysaccharide biosynthesis polyprenyl glycosylphosphotransferase n=1 Tax=Algibacter pacificus TaxID=2599389 RepID=UPI0011C7C081|nr:exopolysaccharide biosynthesis polyprenyl glycosylphosphotransferase [Algibacter pacificus]